jgi:rubrerythrin
MALVVTKTSTPEQLLQMALARERASVALYGEMMRHSSGALMRDLLSGLRDDERQHVRAIEKKLNDLLDGRL